MSFKTFQQGFVLENFAFFKLDINLLSVPQSINYKHYNKKRY